VLRDLEPAERFMSVLGTLLEQRRVRLVQRGTSPRADDVEAVGWYDQDFAYLLPEAARRRVATFLRESGEAWAHSANALHKALVRKGGGLGVVTAVDLIGLVLAAAVALIPSIAFAAS